MSTRYAVDSSGEQDREIDLRDVVVLLLDEWRRIALIMLAVLLVAVVYIVAAVPVYETNALVQIEEKNAGVGGIAELSSLLSGETPTEAEIEIVRSRSVLLRAIEQRGLDITVQPRRFPLIGNWFARRHDNNSPAGAWPGFGQFAWGGEQLRVDRLEIDRGLDGVALTLVAGENGSYVLRGPDDEQLLAGLVGEPAAGEGAAMRVSELVARPGTEFEITHADAMVTLTDLRERLHVVERGRQTGILELSLDGANRDEIAATLNAIVDIYVGQNVARRSAEAAQTLRFINAQLPELKTGLNAAEQALNDFRVQAGSVDLSLETQGMLEQLAELERRASELGLRRAELTQRFTAEHPAMLALAQQHADIEIARQQLDAQIRNLPEAEQNALRLMRDVRVANELYTLLLNRAQELKVVEAGTVGNVRVIDTAFVPRIPVAPKSPLILAASLVIGAMLGVFVVFLRQMLDGNIHDPKELEQAFELPVYAIVPRSAMERELSERVPPSLQLLAVQAPDDPAIESLRSLRTSLAFLLQEAGSNIIAIGGSAPALGKSFCSANLAVLFAQVGQRVLVVDADLRKGHLHHKFAMMREPGFNELILGKAGIDDVARPAGPENLSVITSGRFPPNPAELLASGRVEKLFAEFSSRYDLVVVDAPPVLAASEAAHLARLAGINLLVVRSGRQNRREVELAIERLRRAGAVPSGFIFNDMAVGSRRYAYAGYRYYRYDKDTLRPTGKQRA